MKLKNCIEAFHNGLLSVLVSILIFRMFFDFKFGNLVIIKSIEMLESSR